MLMQAPIYILGGSQTDFARNWAREQLEIYDLFAEALQTAISDAGIEPAQIEVGHVGNFVGDLFSRQGLLGGFFGQVYPELGKPSHRSTRGCLRVGINRDTRRHARYRSRPLRCSLRAGS
jgi:acetyl-CoA C-acetyltransferase